jgi:hypothetical protein
MTESSPSIDIGRLKPGARIRLPGRGIVVQLIAATPEAWLLGRNNTHIANMWV